MYSLHGDSTGCKEALCRAHSLFSLLELDYLDIDPLYTLHTHY